MVTILLYPRGGLGTLLVTAKFWPQGLPQELRERKETISVLGFLGTIR